MCTLKALASMPPKELWDKLIIIKIEHEFSNSILHQLTGCKLKAYFPKFLGLLLIIAQRVEFGDIRYIAITEKFPTDTV
jgi:hypothetical protein